ncbi:acyl-CoA dehydrogenase family protein, partial [Salmonella enterica subsp. enterica serovar Typhimurium]
MRDAVRSLCSEFDDKYHRKMLIPEEFGGSGLGLTEASII